MSLKTSNYEIVLGRIDNRLVHGRVGIIWTQHFQATTILVVDDEVSQDFFQQELMNKTVENKDIKILYWSVQDAVENMANLDGEKILLITRTPFEMYTLIEKGIKIPKVNLGIMHRSTGKRKFASKFIFVDDKDLEAIYAIRDSGAVVTANILPGAKEIVI